MVINTVVMAPMEMIVNLVVSFKNREDAHKTHELGKGQNFL